jgi:hypothetical protein
MVTSRIVFIAIGAIIGIGVAFAAVFNFQDQEIQQIPVSAINEEKFLPFGTTSFMYPGEPLPADEMRVTVFGTGWGFVRPGQADQSIFVETLSCLTWEKILKQTTWQCMFLILK